MRVLLVDDEPSAATLHAALARARAGADAAARAAARPTRPRCSPPSGAAVVVARPGRRATRPTLARR